MTFGLFIVVWWAAHTVRLSKRPTAFARARRRTAKSVVSAGTRNLVCWCEYVRGCTSFYTVLLLFRRAIGTNERGGDRRNFLGWPITGAWPITGTLLSYAFRVVSGILHPYDHTNQFAVFILVEKGCAWLAALAATLPARSSQQANHLQTQARGGQEMGHARVPKGASGSSARLDRVTAAHWRMLRRQVRPSSDNDREHD